MICPWDLDQGYSSKDPVTPKAAKKHQEEEIGIGGGTESDRLGIGLLELASPTSRHRVPFGVLVVWPAWYPIHPTIVIDPPALGHPPPHQPDPRLRYVKDTPLGKRMVDVFLLFLLLLVRRHL